MITPLSSHTGAEVTGVDLTQPVDAALREHLNRAFVAHSVLSLAFRGSDYVPVSVNPSLPVLGFAVLAAFVTAILCAIIPAWISTKTDPASAIRGTSRTMKDSSSTVQRVLVVHASLQNSGGRWWTVE